MVRKEREKSQKISENYHVFLCDKDDESHSGDVYMTRIWVEEEKKLKGQNLTTKYEVPGLTSWLPKVNFATH